MYLYSGTMITGTPTPGVSAPGTSSGEIQFPNGMSITITGGNQENLTFVMNHAAVFL